MVERRGERECNTGIGLDEEEGRLLWSEGLVLGLGEWWWGVEEQEGLGGVTMEEEPRITSSRIADTPSPQPLFLVGLSFREVLMRFAIESGLNLKGWYYR